MRASALLFLVVECLPQDLSNPNCLISDIDLVDLARQALVAGGPLVLIHRKIEFSPQFVARKMSDSGASFLH
jgi:hypothetical protein